MRDKNLPFESKELLVCIGQDFNNATRKIILPSNPEKVLDSVSEALYEKDKFLPYWAEHWPSCPVLLDYLLKNIPLDTAMIGELGCGLGVLSTVLTSLGKMVISTDIALDACRFAKANIQDNNGIQRVVCTDWRQMPFKATFDYIIASDILYEQRWVDPVLKCISMLLKDHGTAIIADPCRTSWELFKSAAIHQGLRCVVSERKVINDKKTTIEIVTITR